MMTTTQPSEIRVGDAERERMAARLTRAHAAGQLQLDEFDERVKLAYEARVQTDLDALVTDLPSENPHRGGAPWSDAGRGGPRTAGRVIDESPDGSWPHPPWVSGRGIPPHWRGGPAQWRQGAALRGGGIPRGVLIVLAVIAGLMLIGPLIGFLFRVLFTVLIIVGIVALVGKFRHRHHR